MAARSVGSMSVSIRDRAGRRCRNPSPSPVGGLQVAGGDVVGARWQPRGSPPRGTLIFTSSGFCDRSPPRVPTGLMLFRSDCSGGRMTASVPITRVGRGRSSAQRAPRPISGRVFGVVLGRDDLGGRDGIRVHLIDVVLDPVTSMLPRRRAGDLSARRSLLHSIPFHSIPAAGVAPTWIHTAHRQQITRTTPMVGQDGPHVAWAAATAVEHQCEVLAGPHHPVPPFNVPASTRHQPRSVRSPPTSTPDLHRRCSVGGRGPGAGCVTHSSRTSCACSRSCAPASAPRDCARPGWPRHAAGRHPRPCLPQRCDRLPRGDRSGSNRICPRHGRCSVRASVNKSSAVSPGELEERPTPVAAGPGRPIATGRHVYHSPSGPVRTRGGVGTRRRRIEATSGSRLR